MELDKLLSLEVSHCTHNFNDIAELKSLFVSKVNWKFKTDTFEYDIYNSKYTVTKSCDYIFDI